MLIYSPSYLYLWAGHLHKIPGESKEIQTIVINMAKVIAVVEVKDI